ncbi:hypothetical protein KFK09_017540 [Dendrobium nobile]|uniref:Uncharacterized protein n=1 Tax=Dendrobium nobile TaxID=94219 RepID=A0A8T3B189_DENNO|nr:hypothetical protein KFK09_017540 [Dendrobium nobile]
MKNELAPQCHNVSSTMALGDMARLQPLLAMSAEAKSLQEDKKNLVINLQRAEEDNRFNDTFPVNRSLFNSYEGDTKKFGFKLSYHDLSNNFFEGQIGDEICIAVFWCDKDERGRDLGCGYGRDVADEDKVGIEVDDMEGARGEEIEPWR